MAYSLKSRADLCNSNAAIQHPFFPHERSSQHIFNIDNLKCRDTPQAHKVFEETFKIKLGAIAKEITQVCSNQTSVKPDSFNPKLCDFPSLLSNYFSINKNIATFINNESVIIAPSTYPWQRDQDAAIGSWFTNVFETADVSERFIILIVQKSVYERALTRYLEEYKKYKSSLRQYQNSTTLNRTGLEYAISYLRFKDPLLWSIHLSLNAKCLKAEKGCEEQRKSFIESVITGNSAAWKRLSELKDMILNYSLQPWPEAEDLKDMYQMLTLFMSLNTYTFPTLPSQQDLENLVKENIHLKNYKKQLRDKTLNPFAINSSDENNGAKTYTHSISVYRAAYSLIQLINLYQVNNNIMDPLLTDSDIIDEKLLVRPISDRIQAINSFFSDYEQEVSNATN